MGVDRKSSARGQNDANDPKRKLESFVGDRLNRAERFSKLVRLELLIEFSQFS